MAEIYVTQEDDTWDLIAHRVMGSTKYTHLLIAENITLADIVFFDSGTELTIPDVLGSTSSSSSVNLPPWLE